MAQAKRSTETVVKYADMFSAMGTEAFLPCESFLR